LAELGNPTVATHHPQSLDRDARRFGEHVLKVLQTVMEAVYRARGSPPDIPLRETHARLLAKLFTDSGTASSRFWLDSKGILPLQLRKAREIGIGRDKLAAVFNGKGREVCVCYQVADGLTTGQHLLEDTPMPLGRLDHSRTGLLQPTLYSGKCLAQREGVLENPGIGSYTNERG
jgi:hypothetical protein